MKSNLPLASTTDQSSLPFTRAAAHEPEESTLLLAPAGSFSRILLGIDVPTEALSRITADWEKVAATQRDAPDMTPAAVGTALRRLQQHAVNVAGVAVLERSDPFAAWRPDVVARAAA
jgi:hypothetical protein